MVSDFQGAGLRESLAVVVGEPLPCGDLAARSDGRRDTGLGDEDLLAGVTPIAVLVGESWNRERVYPSRDSAAVGRAATACFNVMGSATGSASAAEAGDDEVRGRARKAAAKAARIQVVITTWSYRGPPAAGSGSGGVPPERAQRSYRLCWDNAGYDRLADGTTDGNKRSSHAATAEPTSEEAGVGTTSPPGHTSALADHRPDRPRPDVTGQGRGVQDFRGGVVGLSLFEPCWASPTPLSCPSSSA